MSLNICYDVEHFEVATLLNISENYLLNELLLNNSR